MNNTDLYDLYNVSPLRYPGGKTRACKIIESIANNYFDLKHFDTLVSPFFGGGSFEFYLQNKYGFKLVVNDKFTPLYHFWTQAKQNKNELCHLLKNVKSVSKQDFQQYRTRIMSLNNDPLQQAFHYFIINRCSFSGATLSGGFSEEASKKRFTPSSIEKIEKLNLHYTQFYNLDFEPFVEQYHNDNDTSNTLVFLDPPYYLQNSKLYGNKGDMHEHFDHQRLFNTINNKKNWIMTYNDCDYIRDLYKHHTIIEANWNYGMNNSKKSSEIIIISVDRT